jgi:hypothetical protein
MANTRQENIRVAEKRIEAALSTLRDFHGGGWTENGFKSLYYLVRLAKAAK